MTPLVKKLEERLLPEFEKVAGKIRLIIPNILVTVYSSSSGSETEFQGYDFWIDCIFTDCNTESDNVVLGVELCHITTTPRISADVGWCSPSCYTEAEFYEWHGSFTENGLIITDDVLEDLYRDLPRLYEALFEALKRRKPANE
jgi:hypothetical protein